MYGCNVTVLSRDWDGEWIKGRTESLTKWVTRELGEVREDNDIEKYNVERQWKIQRFRVGGKS